MSARGTAVVANGASRPARLDERGATTSNNGRGRYSCSGAAPAARRRCQADFQDRLEHRDVVLERERSDQLQVTPQLLPAPPSFDGLAQGAAPARLGLFELVVQLPKVCVGEPRVAERRLDPGRQVTQGGTVLATSGELITQQLSYVQGAPHRRSSRLQQTVGHGTVERSSLHEIWVAPDLQVLWSQVRLQLPGRAPSVPDSGRSNVVTTGLVLHTRSPTEVLHGHLK